MTEKKVVPLPEAPASVNFKGVTKGGFICQWTLRDVDEDVLLNKQVSFIKKLAEGGVEPYPNGKPVAALQNKQVPPEFVTTQQPEGGIPENWCSIHGVEMTKWDKEGRSWFSHKADDDTWCKGK
jgi:hypothetical protein